MTTNSKKKCEALIGNDGKSWSIIRFSDKDDKTYHRCGRPASVRVSNPEDLGPEKIWLCSDCDQKSATQKSTL